VSSGSLHVSSGTHIKSGTSRVNAGKQNANSGRVYVNTARITRPVLSTPTSQDHPLKHMEHIGIFDSGCSGHMTGNRAHLEDYQELSKVGFVTFGGSKGSISGKDDIIFGSTKKSWSDEFEALMKGRFQMSDMGELTFFLGLPGLILQELKYLDLSLVV
ncbi:hypothetical protein Tco_0129676, partial [Tanacetum coccineum]